MVQEVGIILSHEFIVIAEDGPELRPAIIDWDLLCSVLKGVVRGLEVAAVLVIVFGSVRIGFFFLLERQ